MKKNERKEHGFTLIELLVVISIIALLLSVLVPSLRKAKEQARNAACKNNLRQLAVGVITYAADNGGRTMETPLMWGEINRYPTFLLVNKTSNDPKFQGKWNVHLINPYVNSAWTEEKKIGGVFICPCANREAWETVSNTFWEITDNGDNSIPFTQISYLYFAGSENWHPSTLGGSAKKDVATSLLGNRLLLSDTFMVQLDANYRYNHGKRGMSWNTPNSSLSIISDGGWSSSSGTDIDFLGMNEANTDGSVFWKSVREFDKENFRLPRAYDGGYVMRPEFEPFVFYY
jgi:prepilin-type N-terminal cleavage/methylation domain-containing protein